MGYIAQGVSQLIKHAVATCVCAGGGGGGGVTDGSPGEQTADSLAKESDACSHTPSIAFRHCSSSKGRMW